ncbi:leucine-rich repeat protein [Mycoplasmopsis ciconiae]|uniref:Leucine-rich repeat protein n=1 Tax=Mycoplasmopsis ciconiae TaxID=561067 RepID=A0ABU7MM65_9BACT|nr:leucine-rich repeat protein [Mycoplasmopsis ciconiae]
MKKNKRILNLCIFTTLSSCAVFASACNTSQKTSAIPENPINIDDSTNHESPNIQTNITPQKKFEKITQQVTQIESQNFKYVLDSNNTLIRLELKDKNLKKIDLSEITNLESIASDAFALETNLEEINLGSAKVIESNAFKNNKTIKKIVGSQLVKILDSAFENSTLEELQAPFIAEIGISALRNTNLKQLQAPQLLKVKFKGLENTKITNLELNNLIEADAFAFANNQNLQSFEALNLSLLSNNAFINDINLATINAPKLNTNIGANAFNNTKWFNNIFDQNINNINQVVFNKTLVHANLKNLDSEYQVDTNVENIAQSPFVNTEKVKKIDLSSVKDLGDSSLNNFYALEKIKANNLENIGIGSLTNTKVKNLEFPKLKQISDRALKNVDSLESFIAPNLQKIGVEAFQQTTKLKNVTLNKVTELGNSAFSRSGLSAVEMDSLDTIPARAFEGTKIIDINFPNVTKIMQSSFEDVSTIKTVNLPNVLEIGLYAFLQEKVGNDFLVELNLPKVKQIGDRAFSNFKKLEKISLDSVIKIGSNNFDAYGIGEFDFENDHLKEVNLPNVEYIDNGAFANRKNLSKINAPKLKGAGKGLFQNSKWLLDTLETNDFAILNNVLLAVKPYVLKEEIVISIPQEVTYISDSAFQDAEQLQKVYLNNTEVIGNNAFLNAKNLSQVVGLKVKKINDQAFRNTSIIRANFPELEILGDNSNLENERGVFADVWKLESFIAPKLKVVNDQSFHNKNIEPNISRLKEFIAPNLEKIGKYAFSGTKLKNLNFENVTQVDEFAFSDMDELISINLKKVKEIKDGTFSANASESKLQTINAPLLQKIGHSAFSNAKNLTNIDLDNVVFIGNYAFKNVKNIKQMNLLNVKEIGERAFENTSALELLNIPKITELKGNELIDSPIKYFSAASLKVLPANIFKDNIFITKVNVPHVLKIAKNAFENATNLEQINANNVKEIEEFAFHNAIKVKKFDLPNLKVVGRSTFENAKSVTTYNLENLEEAGVLAFASNLSLQSINLPKIKAVADKLFEGSYSLENISFENAKDIEVSAFDKTPWLELQNKKQAIIINNVLYKYNDNSARIVNLPNVIKVAKRAFSDLNNIEEVILENVIEIEPYAFANTNAQINSEASLKRVQLDKVEKIGLSAFQFQNRLTNIYMPNVKVIDGNAFYETNIDILNAPNLEVIYQSAFENVQNLKQINLPKIKEIHESAFRYNTNLNNFDFGQREWWKTTQINELAFTETPIINVINAKITQYEAYKDAIKLINQTHFEDESYKNELISKINSANSKEEIYQIIEKVKKIGNA